MHVTSNRAPLEAAGAFASMLFCSDLHGPLLVKSFAVFTRHYIIAAFAKMCAVRGVFSRRGREHGGAEHQTAVGIADQTTKREGRFRKDVPCVAGDHGAKL